MGVLDKAVNSLHKDMPKFPTGLKGKILLVLSTIVVLFFGLVGLAGVLGDPPSSDNTTAAPMSSASASPVSSASGTPASSATATPEETASPEPPESPDGQVSVANSDVSKPSTATTVKGNAILDLLNQLPVKGRAPKTGYARSQFGQRWADVDRNGCDTRNDILKRDLKNLNFKSGTHNCLVLAGMLNDPYTGKSIEFIRGPHSAKVQIDHVVALSNAWQTGAQQIGDGPRTAFANDPLNLLAVDGRSNQQKGDGDAATWLPSNKAFRCSYVSRQIQVKHKYHLWVTAPEKEAMIRVLSNCGVKATVSGSGNRPAPNKQAPSVKTPAPAKSRQAHQSSKAPAPASARPKPTPKPARKPASKPAPNTGGGVYYKNCRAAWNAGAAPLHRGDPGYRPKMDGDGDGIACEKRPR